MEITYTTTTRLTKTELAQVMSLEIFEDGIEGSEELYLAIQNGAVVGAMQVIGGNTILNLQAACGAPAGTGSALVKSLQEYCGDDGVKIQDAISEAIGFYEKMGFEKTQERAAGQWDMIWWPE